MSEISNTFSSYLGPEFQKRLMWQLLVEPEFAEKAIQNLSVEYFDDPNLKKLFTIYLEYYKEFEKVPNLQNQSIKQAIHKFRNPNNLLEEESLLGVIQSIEHWNERIINKQILYDGDAIRSESNFFIKQQEFRKLAEYIMASVKNADIRKKHTVYEIEQRMQKIARVGEDDDYGTSVMDNVDKVLRKEFRETIPTGVHVIDTLTGGGLGKGEMGIILTPSGVGKTTILTKIANTAFEVEKNVLQIVFEDTTEQIQRKHYTIWSKVPLSQIDDNTDFIRGVVDEKMEKMAKSRGQLIVKKFSQEDTTMLDIRNYIMSYQKKFGIKFDLLVLDYLDCVESHKRTPDRNEAELVIVKSFEALASDLQIPAWTAIQSNRSGFDAEYVEAYQSGGNIKRIQKAHFFMSVAKTSSQKEAGLANIRIIKARFAQDGQTFNDCIFNNDTMEIRIEDDRYPYNGKNTTLKKYGEEDINKMENHANGLRLKDGVLDDKPTMTHVHTKICETVAGRETEIIQKLNEETEDKNEGINEETNEGINDTVNQESPTPNTDKNDDLLELDENNTENQITIEAENTEEKNNTSTDLLDWSGETETASQTVEVVEEKPVDVTQFKPPGVTVVEPPLAQDMSLDDLENLLDDPDENYYDNNETTIYLLNAREKQKNVVKRE